VEPAPRRTQAERSAGTRALLVEAAVDTLVERGWAATTAVAVCTRAGVTRGALVHHFGGLPGLLAGALDHLYGELSARSEPAPTLAGEIDRLWRAASDRRFKAVLEAWMAVGNDPVLAAELAPVVARFAELMAPGERGAAAVAPGSEAEAAYLTAREAILGLALGRSVTGGWPLPHEARVLDELRARAAALDTAPATTSDTGPSRGGRP